MWNALLPPMWTLFHPPNAMAQTVYDQEVPQLPGGGGGGGAGGALPGGEAAAAGAGDSEEENEGAAAAEVAGIGDGRAQARHRGRQVIPTDEGNADLSVGNRDDATMSLLGNEIV